MTIKNAPPTTRLCRSNKQQVFVRDADLCEELIGKISFTEMLYYHLMGRRASTGETAMLDAILVALMEHGFTPSAIATRMVAVSSPEAMQAAVAAGLLAVGSMFIGTIEDSARLLHQIVSDGGDVAATCGAKVREYKSQKRHIPGFGHHLHKPDDPRTPVLLKVARESGQAGVHVEVLQVLSAEVDRAYKCHVTVNVTGIIGAILSDMNFPVDVVRGLAVISRAAGLVGHIKEEREQPAARFIWELAEANINNKAGPGEG
jgi:citrate synthase